PGSPPAFPGRHGSAAAPAWRGRYRLAGSLLALGTLAAVALAWAVDWPQSAGTAAALPAPPGPSLTLKPFANLSSQPEVNYYAAGLTDELLAQLVRFKELTVLVREASGDAPPGDMAGKAPRLAGSRYLLEGGIRLSD